MSSSLLLNYDIIIIGGGGGNSYWGRVRSQCGPHLYEPQGKLPIQKLGSPTPSSLLPKYQPPPLPIVTRQCSKNLFQCNCQLQSFIASLSS